MSAASDYLEIEMAKYAFTTEVMAVRPTAWYVALHSADPTDAGTSNELVSAWYTRQAVTWTRSNNIVSNTAQINFPNVTGGTAIITHLSIKDALSGGNTLAKLALTSPLTVPVGDNVRFNAGAISLTVD